MPEMLTLSTLTHTWLIDLDGTIVKHNGYKIDGHDTLLAGAAAFIESLPCEDMVIFLTSRKPEFKDMTEAFLRDHKIRFDKIIYNLPYGERILVNDAKPSGLRTAYAINLNRDAGIDVGVKLDGDI